MDNFEMHSSRALISKYLEDYLDALKIILSMSSNENMKLIKRVCNRYPDLPDIVYSHLIENGKTHKEMAEIFEKEYNWQVKGFPKRLRTQSPNYFTKFYLTKLHLSMAVI